MCRKVYAWKLYSSVNFHRPDKTTNQDTDQYKNITSIPETTKVSYLHDYLPHDFPWVTYFQIID